MKISPKPLVLHIRACNFFGGPEKQIINHIKTSKLFNHRVISFIEGNTENQLIQACIKEKIPCSGIYTNHSYEISSIYQMRTVFKNLRPQIICSHGYRPTMISLLAKLGLNISLIIFSRGHTHENFKVKIFEKFELKMLRFAQKIIAVSEGYSDYLIKKGINKKKITTVKNAIDIKIQNNKKWDAAAKRYELGFSHTDFLIATAGRLSPEKAQMNLIKAFSMLTEKHKNIHLLLLGDGPLEKEFEQYIADNRLDHIHLLGFRKDVMEIMNTIDLFVLPSLTEGLPNVVLEAFLCKKPVVATKVGGVPEVVDHLKNGIIVPPNDVQRLADGIEYFLTDQKIMLEMGKAGFAKLQKVFSLEKQTERLETIYSELI